MINLSCSNCGSDLTLTASSEWSGKVNAEAHCAVCTDVMNEALDDNTILSDKNDDLTTEISGLYDDLELRNEELDKQEHQIKELKDFIDGYIDDKETK